ncbi:MAG: hypothetical protein ACTH6N_05055 [Brachybacterium tyrofermentans]|uniref:hypothetical protein n=1 Tax=Brachybacterium tyrofermentans TaxID=47848 RepID=UPI001867E4A2|nr:hypothetical protein [Brachybacterium tyrofermentans]
MLRIDRKLVFLDIEATSLDTLTARPWEIATIERWPSGAERRTTIMISDVDTTHADPKSLEFGRFDERHVQDGRARWLTESLTALWIARRMRETAEHGRPLLVGSAVGTYDAPILAAMLARHGFVPEWHHHPIDLMTWAQAREAESPFGTISLREHSSYDLSELAGVPRPAAAVAHTAMGDALWARDWWDAIKGVVA